MTWNIPIKPDDVCTQYLTSNYHYDALNGLFYWIKDGGKGKSKHFSGDAVSGKFGGGYLKLFSGSRYLNASHVAWWFVHGEWPSQTVDHINRDPHDNRIENLRLADASVQSNNRKGWNAEGLPKGVQRRGCRFRAYRNKTHLGVFDTVVEAKQAYEAAYV